MEVSGKDIHDVMTLNDNVSVTLGPVLLMALTLSVLDMPPMLSLDSSL